MDPKEKPGQSPKDALPLMEETWKLLGLKPSFKEAVGLPSTPASPHHLRQIAYLNKLRQESLRPSAFATLPRTPLPPVPWYDRLLGWVLGLKIVNLRVVDIRDYHKEEDCW